MNTAFVLRIWVITPLQAYAGSLVEKCAFEKKLIKCGIRSKNKVTIWEGGEDFLKNTRSLKGLAQDVGESVNLDAIKLDPI